eukprot:1392655-Ditylum_brightwellii.AAC.1
MNLTVEKHNKDEQDVEEPHADDHIQENGIHPMDNTTILAGTTLQQSITLPSNIITITNGSTSDNNLVNTENVGITIETKSNAATNGSLITLVNNTNNLQLS